MANEILYVIAAWGGPRRTRVPEYDRDRSFFLRTHLEQVAALEHDCEVLVVNNVGEQPFPGYAAYLDHLPAGITLLHRPNEGMSYGAWSFAYGLYRDRFRYYLLMEDDYVPTLDHFDTLLRDLLEERGLDYLGGYYDQKGPFPPHMGCSCGLVRQTALERVWLRYGRLPHPPNSVYGQVEQQGQVALGQALLQTGGTLGDYTDVYATPYFGQAGNIRTLGTGRPLIVPVPMLTRTPELARDRLRQAAAPLPEEAPDPDRGTPL